MRYFLNIQQLSSCETNLLDIWSRTAGWRFTLEPLSWFITIYNFCVTRIDGRDIELVILWDVEPVIYSYIISSKMLSYKRRTYNRWHLMKSCDVFVTYGGPVQWIHRDAPRFADPYFESSKNMASSHSDGKFHPFHHQKLSSRSLVYHGKTIRGIMPFYGRTIQNYSNLPRWLWNDGVWVGVIWPKKGWKFCILWTGDVSILFGVLNPPIL